jgi:hypothetical protein
MTPATPSFSLGMLNAPLLLISLVSIDKGDQADGETREAREMGRKGYKGETWGMRKTRERAE